MLRVKRPKLSGAQNRKRKRDREIALRMQEILANADDSRSDDMNEDDNMETSSRADLFDDAFDTKENFPLTIVECQTDVRVPESLPFHPDPGLWVEELTDEMREQLVRAGPVQIKDIVFPPDETGRRFSTIHYKRVLMNGEDMERKWLIYSQHKNAVYCFCCKLFVKESEAKHWPSYGFTNWRHISRALLTHEKARSHMVSFRKWKELENAIKNQNTSKSEYRHLVEQEKEHCRNVLERFVAVIQFLTTQKLSFHGTSSNLYEDDNGNFLKLIELLAKFDPHVGEHVRRITTNSYLWKVNYMSDMILNELIAVLALQTKKHIADLIKKAKYYSIIISRSIDKEFEEQYSLIVRFVSKSSETQEFNAREHFLGFIPVSNDPSVDINDSIMVELNKLELNVNDIRSQGYDYRSSLKTEQNMFQDRLIQLNKRAFILPCGCHSLISIICDASATSMEVTELFYFTRRIFKLLSELPTYWDALKRNIPCLANVKLSHWEHQNDILDSLRNNLLQIFNTLIEISEDNRNGLYERYQAQDLADSICSFKFICSVIIWHEILIKINTISDFLQAKDVKIQDSVMIMNDVILHFKQYRQIAFSDVLLEAEKIATEMDIDTYFPDIKVIRRISNRLANETADHTVIDPKEHFISNFFEFIIDVTVQTTENKLSQIREHLDIFKCFYEIPELRSVEDEILKDYCVNVDKVLRDGDFSDIDGGDLFVELKNLFSFLHDGMSMMDIMNFISKNDLETIFPNLIILLRILFTFPLMRRSSDGYSSKLVVIEDYLESSLADEKSLDLPILSIEKDITNSLNLTDTIDAFTSVQCPNENAIM